MPTTNNFISNRRYYQQPQFLCIPLCIMLLTGCLGQPQLVKDLKLYQQRLANVLESTPPEWQQHIEIIYPSNKTLLAPIADIRLPLTDFFALQHCPLGNLIAQRNTPLGRTQYLSTRLIYEATLLRAIKNCLQQPINLSEPQQLKMLLQQKLQDFPLAWANMLQSSKETRNAFSNSATYLKGDKTDGLTESLLALNYLISINADTEINAQQLENSLLTLTQYRLPVKIWRSQALLTQQLQNLTQWLAEENQPIDCNTPQGKKQAAHLQNVFKLFFIAKIQPIASKLNTYHYQLQPIYQTLRQHEAIQPAFHAFIQRHVIIGFTQYQQAMQQHIAWWQTFYQRCHLSPGR